MYIHVHCRDNGGQIFCQYGALYYKMSFLEQTSTNVGICTLCKVIFSPHAETSEVFFSYTAIFLVLRKRNILLKLLYHMKKLFFCLFVFLVKLAHSGRHHKHYIS